MSPVTGATLLIHDFSIVTCPNLEDTIVGGIVAYPEARFAAVTSIASYVAARPGDEDRSDGGTEIRVSATTTIASRECLASEEA